MSTTPPTPDVRTYNRRLLDQIRALLAGKAMDDVAMYKIGTRELTHIPLPELLQWEATVEARVRNERRRARGKGAQSAFIIFGSADRRGPRFASFRLLLGRVLIALMSDPGDKQPAPVERKSTPAAVTLPLAKDSSTDESAGGVILNAGAQIYFRPPPTRKIYRGTEDHPTDSQPYEAMAFDWNAFTSSGSSSESNSFDSGSYSSDSGSSSDSSSFSGGDGGDSGGAGAGGGW